VGAGEDDLAQQQLVMLNMDPPLTPATAGYGEQGVHPRMGQPAARAHPRRHRRITDQVIERVSADFVTDIAAELPLV